MALSAYAMLSLVQASYGMTGEPSPIFGCAATAVPLPI
jgi:hypothetical protein